MYSSLALFTDFYELTMRQAYFDEGMTADAVFSLFVRHLPPRLNFLQARGPDTVLGYLETLRFDDENLTCLASLDKFSNRFLDRLRAARRHAEGCRAPERGCGTPSKRQDLAGFQNL
jgi:nicotinate phosphoribosyltransferase